MPVDVIIAGEATVTIDTTTETAAGLPISISSSGNFEVIGSGDWSDTEVASRALNVTYRAVGYTTEAIADSTVTSVKAYIYKK